MQIAHISDTHLGASQFNLKEREEDVYEAFSEVIDTAIKDKVDMVIHSGDIFDDPRPYGTALSILLDQLKRLNENGIKFLFTLGEHDISRIPGVPSVAIFQKVGLAKYIGGGEALSIDDLLIVGFHKYRRTEIDDLIEKLSGLDKLTSNYSGKKILVMHQALLEAHRYAGELSYSSLPKSFDYYAMGHLHDRFEKKFDEIKGIVCYPGSIDPTGVEGFEGLKKGFYIVDTSGYEVKPEWIEIKSTRPQIQEEIDYDKIDDKVNAIIQSMIALSKKPVVHIRVRGEKIETAKVTRALQQLQPYALYYDWEPVEQGEGLQLRSSKPQDIDEEMFKIAVNLMKNEKLAIFAIKELLPLLKEERKSEAYELLWKAYEQRRFSKND